MKKEDFASLQRAMGQVEAYRKGDRRGFATHEPVDVKAVRTAIGKTQAEFASTYGLPLGTVRDWEQNRRQPDAPARALLTLIEREPEHVAKVLAKV